MKVVIRNEMLLALTEALQAVLALDGAVSFEVGYAAARTLQRLQPEAMALKTGVLQPYSRRCREIVEKHARRDENERPVASREPDGSITYKLRPESVDTCHAELEAEIDKVRAILKREVEVDIERIDRAELANIKLPPKFVLTLVQTGMITD